MESKTDHGHASVILPPSHAGSTLGTSRPNDLIPISLDNFPDNELLVREKGYVLGPHKLHVYQDGVRKIPRTSLSPPGAFEFGRAIGHMKFSIVFAAKDRIFRMTAHSASANEVEAILFVGWSNGEGGLYTRTALPGPGPSGWSVVSTETAIVRSIDIIAPATLLLGEFGHEPFD